MRGKNTKFLLSCTAFLFLCMLAYVVCVASAGTIFVPDDYAKIQWAVDNASTGDTIIVRDGTYVENIDINKRLTIKSENGSAYCIVQAANPRDHVFNVSVAACVNIEGFTVQGAADYYDYAGIYLNSARSCNILSNYITNNEVGIRLKYSSNNNISGNSIISNNEDGIYFFWADFNMITGNTISNNGLGIDFWSSSNNNISGNSISNNDMALGESCNNNISGNSMSSAHISLYQSSESNIISGNIVRGAGGAGIRCGSNNNIISGNIISGATAEGIDISSDFNIITGNTISNNKYGICLSYASNNNISGNKISSNSLNGIYLNGESDNNKISGNIISNNKYGIQFDKPPYERHSGRYNNISGNIISNNEDGIHFYDAHSNIITGNIISNNRQYDIYLFVSCSNIIYLNNFINKNEIKSSYRKYNIWNSTFPITYQYNNTNFTNYLGNYWSDYNGSDANGDGIGEKPYKVDDEVYDYHPLIEPWENYFPKNKPPIASFTYTPENPAVEETITFDASSSYDPDGIIVSYEWDFDDGNTATGKIVNHAYSSAGEYTITLTVTDNSSLTNSTTRKVKVIEEGIPNISWNMTISATNQLEPVIVGIHPNATDGYDPEFDVFAQTPVQGKVILILDGIYSTSIKKTRCYNESVSWNLSVGVPAGQTTNLSWDVPSNVNLTISEGGKVLSPGSQLGEGSHELTVTAELLELQGFSINLKAGWNMVSLPLIPDNRSVYAIFGSIPTLNTMPVVTWEAPSFVVVEEIEPKIGYWVFTPSDTTINVIGKPITNTTLILKAGWNMVGTVGMRNLSISDIPNQVPERPAVTWVAPSFVETDIIEQGKSAWVFVTTDTTVTIGKTASTVLKAKAVPMIMNIKSITSAKTEAWNLTISATNQLEPVTFGIHPDATNGYDEYDAFPQTPVQGKVIMILDDIYATEINKDKLTWNLSVGVPAGQNTTLTWDSSKIPADVSLSLDGIDMKLQNSMELGEGSHSFVIRGSIGELAGGFDTGKPVDPYPSIFGTHKGTIKPNKTIIAEKLYTYPCAGTGGHTEYARICNSTWCADAKWEGYKGDWMNIYFNRTVVLMPYKTYNITIVTGSYPQIHHKSALPTENGWINCTEFIDANGKIHYDWIPAIKLW